MGMTIWRWSAVVGLICAVLAMILLPFPAKPELSWVPTPSAPTAEVQKLTQAAAAAHDAVRSYRTAQALDHWDAARATVDAAAIRLDTTVPMTVRDSARAILDEQWAALGPRASGAHAEVFVYVDSTSIARPSNAGDTPRPLEGRALVDVVFALPDATDGERCVALVRLRGTTAAHIAALRNQSLIGVCGFFAAFGMPGDGVRPWLSATNYRFARRSDWIVARAPSIDRASLYALSDAGGRCLTSEGDGCLDALRITNGTRRSSVPPAREPASVLDATAPRVRDATLGAAEDELLADAVRSLGPDRFGEFWRSPKSPDAAFLAATGTTLNSWTQQWLTRTYGAVGERPTVRLRDGVWLAIAAPLLLVVAARPRERVLTR